MVISVRVVGYDRCNVPRLTLLVKASVIIYGCLASFVDSVKSPVDLSPSLPSAKHVGSDLSLFGLPVVIGRLLTKMFMFLRVARR